MFGTLSDLLRRDLISGVIPAVCYNDCNNAYLVAQNTGKTTRLCLRGGAFYLYYNQCKDCVDEHSSQIEPGGLATIDESFSPYVNFCNAAQALGPTVTIPASYLSTSWKMVPITLSGSGIDGSTVASTVLYQSLNITSTLPAYFFGANASSLISKFIPSDTFRELALSVASAASAESVPGADDPTSLVYSALEGTSLPSWFRSAIPVAYSTQIASLEAQISTLKAVLSVDTVTGPATSDPTSPDPTTLATTEPPSRASSPPSSRAWIAGAVIGPIFGICLILFGALVLRHRRLAKVRKGLGTTYDAENKTDDKPQLHSDCLQPPQRVIYELGGGHDSVELEVSETLHELPAEVPGERPASNLKDTVSQ